MPRKGLSLSAPRCDVLVVRFVSDFGGWWGWAGLACRASCDSTFRACSRRGNGSAIRGRWSVGCRGVGRAAPPVGTPGQVSCRAWWVHHHGVRPDSEVGGPTGETVARRPAPLVVELVCRHREVNIARRAPTVKILICAHLTAYVLALGYALIAFTNAPGADVGAGIGTLTLGVLGLPFSLLGLWVNKTWGLVIAAASLNLVIHICLALHRFDVDDCVRRTGKSGRVDRAARAAGRMKLACRTTPAGSGT